MIRISLSLPMLGPAPPARTGAFGFTLIELVIVLALIGLITLLLFSGLKLGTTPGRG